MTSEWFAARLAECAPGVGVVGRRGEFFEPLAAIYPRAAKWLAWEAVARADPRRLHVAAFHPTGTARAGADEKRCPVDEHGRLRGVRNVLVADASVLPTCPEVNPQVSIMAAAQAIASAA